jgi:sulfur-oxidizing protein SoxX
MAGRAIVAGFGAVLGLLLAGVVAIAEMAANLPLVSYEIVGDAIPAALTGAPGDPARGRAIVGDRRVGLCLLCHTGPFPEPRLHGALGPDLRGVGSRLSAGQLRLRLVDGTRLNRDTIMPSYYRIDGLARVAPAYAGKPILSAAQVEDVVAFLATLRD